MGCEKQEKIRFLAHIDLWFWLFRVILPHLVVTIYKFSNIWLAILICIIFKEMINAFAYLARVPWSPEKAIILSGKEPRRWVAPNIPTVIKNQMILCSGRKNILHGFRLKVHILIPTDNSVRSKALGIFEESYLRLAPCVDIIRRRISSPLMSNPSTNAISIYPRTFGIDVDFKHTSYNKQKFFDVRPHFDYNIVLLHLSLSRLLEFGNQEIVS